MQSSGRVQSETQEIAGFECRNAKIFLARSARSHTSTIISMWACWREFVRRLYCHVISISRESAQNVRTLCNKVTNKHADKIRKYQLKH